MNTSLSHLPEHKQKQLTEIAAIIVKAVDPEKVILFGSHATGRWVEHRYTEGGVTYEYISDYDILVITKSGETLNDYEVQDLNKGVFTSDMALLKLIYLVIERIARKWTMPLQSWAISASQLKIIFGDRMKTDL